MAGADAFVAKVKADGTRPRLLRLHWRTKCRDWLWNRRGQLGQCRMSWASRYHRIDVPGKGQARPEL